MSAPSDPLELVVFLRDQDHFEVINDYIAFYRHRVKGYEWYHGYLGDPVGSHVTISFHDVTDALMFKLTHG